MIISFIIPLHNEEKNCQLLINRITSYAIRNKLDYEIVPVDDKSNDCTGQILQNLSKKNHNIHPVYRKDNNEEIGNTMGKALLDGTKASKGEIVIWTMGDLADDVNTYGAIIYKVKKGYDLVFGSRYMKGGSHGNLDPIKAFLSLWGTIIARLLFGVKVHDITNAFRGFRRQLINKIRLDSCGFSISPEFAIKAHLAGYKLGEVPTVYTNRLKGRSHFKLFSMTKNYLNIYFLLFLKYKFLNNKYDFIKE